MRQLQPFNLDDARPPPTFFYDRSQWLSPSPNRRSFFLSSFFSAEAESTSRKILWALYVQCFLQRKPCMKLACFLPIIILKVRFLFLLLLLLDITRWMSLAGPGSRKGWMVGEILSLSLCWSLSRGWTSVSLVDVDSSVRLSLLGYAGKGKGGLDIKYKPHSHSSSMLCVLCSWALVVVLLLYCISFLIHSYNKKDGGGCVYSPLPFHPPLLLNLNKSVQYFRNVTQRGRGKSKGSSNAAAYVMWWVHLQLTWKAQLALLLFLLLVGTHTKVDLFKECWCNSGTMSLYRLPNNNKRKQRTSLE